MSVDNLGTVMFTFVAIQQLNKTSCLRSQTTLSFSCIIKEL